MRRPVSILLCMIIPVLTVAALLAAKDAAAPDAPKSGAHESGGGHVIKRADQLEWSPAPPGLPPGGSICVLDGDPSKEGLFVFRAKLPAGYIVPPHWHSGDENITVLSGKLFMGHGDTFDKAGATAIGPGDYTRMPAKMHHFAFTEAETIFQLHGRGPFDINYIKATDDPRNKPGAEKPAK